MWGVFIKNATRKNVSILTICFGYLVHKKNNRNRLLLKLKYLNRPNTHSDTADKYSARTWGKTGP